MSNYSQTTIFTPKDSLPPSDPNKTIFGAAYDIEFGNIATAIASKYDTATATAAFPQILATILSATATTRTSTTTLTNDANLQFAIPAAGVYKVEVIFSVGSSAAGGIAFNLNYSGTIGNGGNAIAGASQLGSGSLTIASNNQGLVSNVVNSNAYTIAAAGAFHLVLNVSALIGVSTAGTIALAWAQQASNATPVTLVQGSSMLVTRVA